MQPEAVKLLEDMRQAGQDIIAMMQGKPVETYRSNQQLRWAVERGFEIIGEALTQLRKIDPKAAESITDWRAIIGFRNLLIHGYAIVDPDRTWDIAHRKLPIMLREVTAILT